MPRKMMVAVLVTALGITGMLAVAGGAGAVSKKKSKNTYGVTTVDWQVASGRPKYVKKPASLVSGTTGRQFFKATGLKRYRKWGSKSFTVKANKMSACDSSTTGNCSETKGGKVTFKKLTKAKCVKGNGKGKNIWIYAREIGKMPPHKGYPKGRKTGIYAILRTDKQNYLLDGFDDRIKCPN